MSVHHETYCSKCLHILPMYKQEWDSHRGKKKKKKVPASSIWTRNLTEPIAEYNSDLTLVWQIKNVSYSASVQTSHIPSLSYF